jgi:MFS transporter, ACS family, pantothenate transporter
MCTTVIGSAILTAWPESDASKVAGFFLCAGGYVTAVAWVGILDLSLVAL